MENNKPNMIITEGHSDAIRLLEKMHRNSYYPATATPYLVFHDPAVAETIAEEAYVQTRALQSISNNLIVVCAGAGKPFLHHPNPTAMPPVGFFHDWLEDERIELPKLSENILNKNLDLSNIVVSLKSNNQKD